MYDVYDFFSCIFSNIIIWLYSEHFGCGARLRFIEVESPDACLLRKRGVDMIQTSTCCVLSASPKMCGDDITGGDGRRRSLSIT